MKEHTNPVLRTSPLESHPLSKSGRSDPRGEPVAHKIAARVKPDERLVSLVSPATIEAEQYRTLGLMLEQRRHSGHLQVVAVSSPTMGDGKTVTSINLAAALAQSPQSRVLLVDADFRKPSVQAQLGMRDNNALGFRDAILNPDLALKDIVQRLPGTTLSVLTVGRSQVMPHEVIKSTRFAEVLDEARRDYEWIILDTAPLVLAPDCLMMGRSVDGFVIIVCAHKTSRKEIGEALDILGPSKLLGIVFNHDDSLLDSYGYRTYLSAAQAQQEELHQRS
ncbi:MAG TPA: CpsD/CapB family tyrosine-protein kinase [Nitrospira sp.]|nr:CpsD/CapB family tyrosine-protein kinase [Nitrospira sp.]